MEYITTIGNFNLDYMVTGFHSAGYFDGWNLGTADFAVDGVSDSTASSRKSLVDVHTSGHQTYEFLFRPAVGILNSLKPLATDFEMTISFDRAVSDLALINKTSGSTEALSGKAIELKNLYLQARYFTSPSLRNHFASIAEKDISYNYDELVVYHKNLPQGKSFHYIFKYLYIY